MLFNTPAKIVEAGELIYAQRYKSRLEVERPGEFVAIDVLTGDAYIARFPEEALKEARHQAQTGVFHLIRVGSPGAFRVSHASSTPEPRDWLFQL
jgi:hypothetical protein